MSALAASPSDRREEIRVETSIPVQVAFEGEAAGTLACVDVSASGMRLHYNGQAYRTPGKLLALHFEVPGLREPIAVLGIVRWCEPSAQPGSDGLLGVHFATGLRAREVWAIEQLGLAQPVPAEPVPGLSSSGRRTPA